MLSIMSIIRLGNPLIEKSSSFSLTLPFIFANVGKSRIFYGRTNSQARNVRFYNSTKYNSKEEFEKEKYDQLVREQIIKSTLQENSKMLNATSQINGKKRLSLKTILILIFTSSTISMALYALIQVLRYGKEEKKSRRNVFLPLWVDLNYFYTTRYPFPRDMKYFDKNFDEYISIEMNRLNNNAEKSDTENFNNRFESENIVYQILGEVSRNPTIKQIFGLPLTINTLDGSHFNIWIEPKYPTISGLQINLEKGKSNENEMKTIASVEWAVKHINFRSAINNALVQAGLKLDRLNTSNASIKTHEKSSGRVHEVPVSDKHNYPSISLNGDKDYVILYSGCLLIRDKNKFEEGKVIYKGTLDFDHLLINRGVKILEIELIMKRKDSPNELIKYKIK